MQVCPVSFAAVVVYITVPIALRCGDVETNFVSYIVDLHVQHAYPVLFVGFIVTTLGYPQAIPWT